MLGESTASVLRGINRLGGKHGEDAASFFLNRVPQGAVPSGGRRSVRRGGIWWTLDLDNKLQKRLYLVGSYEKLTLHALARYLQPNDVVLDVGANIGALTLPIARRLQGHGRVIAVEPADDTADRLRNHVVGNGLQDRVHIVEAALSDHEGHAQLRSSTSWPTDTGSRTLEGGSATVGSPVRVMTGDALRQELAIDSFNMIKIDVEGHEWAVLDGLAETFGSHAPRVVLLEVVATHQQRAGKRASSLVRRMEEMGFQGFAIRHRGMVPYTRSFSGNVLFVRSAGRASGTRRLQRDTA